jgi:hypothetical protein
MKQETTTSKQELAKREAKERELARQFNHCMRLIVNQHAKMTRYRGISAFKNDPLLNM